MSTAQARDRRGGVVIEDQVRQPEPGTGRRLHTPASITLGKHIARDPKQPLIRAAPRRIERGDRLQSPGERLRRKVRSKIRPTRRSHKKAEHRSLEVPIKRRKPVRSRTSDREQLIAFLPVRLRHSTSIGASSHICDTPTTAYCPSPLPLRRQRATSPRLSERAKHDSAAQFAGTEFYIGSGPGGRRGCNREPDVRMCDTARQVVAAAPTNQGLRRRRIRDDRSVLLRRSGLTKRQSGARSWSGDEPEAGLRRRYGSHRSGGERGRVVGGTAGRRDRSQPCDHRTRTTLECHACRRAPYRQSGFALRCESSARA